MAVDFEKMSTSERRRLKFKKAATKQLVPHQMQEFKDKAKAIASMTLNFDEDVSPPAMIQHNNR